MKKAKVLILTLLICLGFLGVSACKEPEAPVLATNIETSISDVTLQLGEFKLVDVTLSPENVTKKDFEVIGINTDIVSVTYDKTNMQFTLTAPNEITNGSHITIAVKTTDGSDLQTHININLEPREDAVDVPKNLAFDGEKLVWSSVDNACGYIVNLNGVDEPIVYTNSYAISTVGKQITAKVKAVGETESLNSAYTSELVFEILPAPKNLHFYNGLLQWDAVAGADGYLVYLDGRLFSQPNGNQLDLSNRFTEAKEYEIKVKACGDETKGTYNSSYSESLTVKKLAVPHNFSINQSTVLWNSVVGADKYKLTIDANTANKREILIENVEGQSPSYKLPADLAVGRHTVVLEVLGNRTTILDSDISNELVFEKLDVNSSLKIANGVLEWSVSPKATSYTILINGIPYQTLDVNTTSLDLNDYTSGTYEINIIANGDGINTINSDLYEENLVVTKLASPEQLQITKVDEKSVVSWLTVAGASSYNLKIDGINITDIPLNLTENSYTIPADYVAGTYTFKVACVGNSGTYGDGELYISSNYTTNALLVEKFATVENLRVENGIVKWDKVNPLTGSAIKNYQLNINGNSELLLDYVNNSFNFEGEDFPAGDYTISVKAVGNENVTIDGDYSASLTVTKLARPSLRVEDGKIVEATVENAGGIEYFIQRNSGTSKANQISDLRGSDNEIISVKARAIAGNGTNYINGDYSSVLMVQQLPKVTDISMKLGILEFAEGTYAEINGIEFILTVTCEEDASQDAIINNGTVKSYDFNEWGASNYSVKIDVNAKIEGVQTEDINGKMIYPYLNAPVSSTFNFKKLAAPENLKITNYADNYKTLGDLIGGIGNVSSNLSGGVVWDKVDASNSYTIDIDGVEFNNIIETSTNLQGTVAGGNHTVKVRAEGNGTNVISSDYTDAISFTKLAAPTNVRVEDGMIKWDSSYNSDLSTLMGIPTWLTDANRNAILYVAIINGQNYIALDADALRRNPLSITTLLKQNFFELPNLSAKKCTVNFFALPINVYLDASSLAGYDLDSFMSATLNATNEQFVMSDISTSNVNVMKTDEVTNISLDLNEETGEEVLTWSPLLYENAIEAYEVIVGKGEEQDSFYVKDVDFSDPANCRWVFNKENYELSAGDGAYAPGSYVFGVYLKLIPNSYYLGDDGIKYYYVASNTDNGIRTVVLQTPELKVEDGVVGWNEIKGTSYYNLIIDDAEPLKITDATSFVLGAEYAAGDHTFKVQAVGDGKNYITYDYSAEKTFTKLEKIENVKVAGGVVCYDANSIIADERNNCYYSMKIAGEEYSNNKNVKFELDERFAGNKSYEIYVIAKGDNDRYLNSDISSKCESALANPFKLATPGNLRIQNGELVWDPVADATSYRIYISGLEIEKDSISTSYNFSDVGAGAYYIQVKAIGNDTSYLNSSYTAKKLFTKLGNVLNLTAQNGVITWTVESASNNNLVIAIRTQGEENFVEYNLTAEQMSKKMFELDDSFDAGVYEFYMYNQGGVTSVSSTKTGVISAIKLDAPKNLGVITEASNVQNIAFDELPNAGGYLLKIISENGLEQIVDLGLATKVKVVAEENLQVDFEIITENEEKVLKISSSGKYEISVKAIGSGNSNIGTAYLNSNYSNINTITKPADPEITAVLTNENKFSGKIVWNKVEFADFYKVYVTKYVSEEETITLEPVSTTRTEFYIREKGKYAVSVASCLNTNGFDSNISDALVVEYLLYEGGGVESNPFKVSSIVELNNIKYNMFAYYQLSSNIDFESKSFETIGSETNKFEGVLDGANFSIKNIVVNGDNKYSGLIAYVAENGVIKNLNLNNININGANNCGGLAGINEGLIENCSVSGRIATQNNSANVIIKNGGIVFKNVGTINKCVNLAAIKPVNPMNTVYAGGIAAENFGTISGCGNNGEITATVAGGIVANNEGDLIYCYNSKLAIVTSNAIYQNGIVVPAYAGGLAAQSSGNTTISNSYNHGKVIANSGSSGVQAYAGGLVAYNDGSRITYCYSVNGDLPTEENIVANTINGIDGFAGILVGYNNKGTIASTNIYVYTNRIQQPAYNYSGTYTVGMGFDISGITNTTIYNNISNGDIFLEGKLPTINEKYAKYI